MPTPIVDAIAKALRRLTIPNLTGYGLPTPRAGRTPITRGAASSRSSTSASSVGYRTGLEPLVGHLCVLNERGEPTHHAGRTHPDAPNLHFIGCTISLGGLLRPLPGESRRIARRLASRS